MTFVITLWEYWVESQFSSIFKESERNRRLRNGIGFLIRRVAFRRLSMELLTKK
jgi:hypothetical protein